jgi:hypothetical protein
MVIPPDLTVHTVGSTSWVTTYGILIAAGVALIAAFLTLVGVILSNRAAAARQRGELRAAIRHQRRDTAAAERRQLGELRAAIRRQRREGEATERRQRVELDAAEARRLADADAAVKRDYERHRREQLTTWVGELLGYAERVPIEAWPVFDMMSDLLVRGIPIGKDDTLAKELQEPYRALLDVVVNVSISRFRVSLLEPRLRKEANALVQHCIKMSRASVSGPRGLLQLPHEAIEQSIFTIAAQFQSLPATTAD